MTAENGFRRLTAARALRLFFALVLRRCQPADLRMYAQKESRRVSRDYLPSAESTVSNV